VELEAHELNRLMLILDSPRGPEQESQSLSDASGLWVGNEWKSVPLVTLVKWLHSVVHTAVPCPVVCIEGKGEGPPHLQAPPELVSGVLIQDCHGASIYVPHLSSFVVLRGCTNCVVLGGVAQGR
jgi:hypothetical protein